MIFTVPSSWGSPLREFNQCHDDQGKFCDTGGLPAVTKSAGAVKVGAADIFPKGLHAFRRFLFHPPTGEFVLGDLHEGVIPSITHMEILADVKGTLASAGVFADEWVRGYLFGPSRGLDGKVRPGEARIGMIGVGRDERPDEFFSRVADTVEALSQSGADPDNTMVSGTSALILERATFRKAVKELGIRLAPWQQKQPRRKKAA